MSARVDIAVRKLCEQAAADVAFARQLSASPLQAVRTAAFLSEDDRRLLAQTATRWAPQLSGRAWSQSLAVADLSRSKAAIRALGTINTVSLNHASHLVRPGESLETIALRYVNDATAWWELQQLNRLSANPRPGTRLLLPTGWAGQFADITLTAAEIQHRAVNPLQPTRTPDVTYSPLPFRPKYWGGPTLSLPLEMDVPGFAQAFYNVLVSQGVAGFCLQIRQKGFAPYEVSAGFARFPWEPHSSEWSSDQVMHVASISKLMTAIGMIALANDLSVPLGTTSIVSLLPEYWKIDDSVLWVMLSDPLQMRSGFSDIGDQSIVAGILGSDYFPSVCDSFETAKAVCRIGVSKWRIESYVSNPANYPQPTTGQAQAAFVYANVNYILLRIVIAALVGATDSLAPAARLMGAAIDPIWDIVSINAYKKYLSDRVFARALPNSNAQLRTRSIDTDALGYLPTALPSEPGADPGDVSEIAGEAGWFMSINNLLDVMDAFRDGGIVDLGAGLVPSVAIESDNYGIDTTESVEVDGWDPWRYYSKNGGYPIELPNFSGPLGTAWQQTLCYFMPGRDGTFGGTTLALFANSAIGVETLNLDGTQIKSNVDPNTQVRTGQDPRAIIDVLLPKYVKPTKLRRLI